MKPSTFIALTALIIFSNQLFSAELKNILCEVSQDQNKNEMRKGRIYIKDSNDTAGHGLKKGFQYKFKIPFLSKNKSIYKGFFRRSPNFIVEKTNEPIIPTGNCANTGRCIIDMYNQKPTYVFKSFNKHSGNISHIMKMWVIEFEKNGPTEDGDDLFMISYDENNSHKHKFNISESCPKHLGIIHAGEAG